LRVLLGITGGIAAYKAANLIRLFSEAGHDVTVVPTENALRFIGKPTLEALSGNPVDIDMYSNVSDVRHVALGQQADLIVVAPATAAFLARLAHGLADDLLLNAILASTAPIVIAPAMHTEMWLNPATVANVSTLEGRGVRVMPPASGRLTGSDSGPGRLPEPQEIFDFALFDQGQKLAGLSVLVTAGGTREPIDPVRYVGNSSSGKQGVALARQAALMGARVKLIAANLDIEIPGVDVARVSSAAELERELTSSTADLLVMAAAVSDFTVTKSPKKLRRGSLDSLELVATPDLVSAWAHANPKAVTVAFALEDTEDLLAAAHEKLSAKGVSAIVANRPSALGADRNEVLFVTPDHQSAVSGSKDEVARELLVQCAELVSAAKAKL
jgi:phosphopantothenoylcysteine decarboxylase / phosphopantothenate---cysteine ligase